MIINWHSLIPPLVVSLLALFPISRQYPMIVAFLVGIITAALSVADNIGSALYSAGAQFIVSSGLADLMSVSRALHSANLMVFAFLISMGIIIVLIEQSGAAYAYRCVVARWATNVTSASWATILLSALLFIDDYFSALTVGSVMRPLAHASGLSAVRLALLISLCATTLPLIIPLSSWVGEIVLQLKVAGVEEGAGAIVQSDPFTLYLASIPYILFPWLILCMVLYSIARDISSPQEQVKIPASVEPNDAPTGSAHMSDFIIPLIMLFTSIMSMILYTGNCWIFGGVSSCLGALKTSAIPQSLGWGGMLSVVLTSLYYLVRKRVTLSELPAKYYEGCALMIPSIIMLMLAWTLGAFLKNDLHTGAYIASWFNHIISPQYLPLCCFVLSGVISWMVGSAWATIGLAFPIVISTTAYLVPHHALYDRLVPVVGAALSGSIVGNLLSMMADNPIMASASTGASHRKLIALMYWYVVPVIIATIVGYAYMADGSSNYHVVIGAMISVGILIMLLEMVRWIWNRKKII